MGNQRRIDVGRISFRENRWLVQPLANHVGNVIKLTEWWDNKRAFPGNIPNLSQTRERVIQAAEIHDVAKPAKFRLGYEQNHFTRKWTWTYSFARHRFEAFHADPYAQALAQLHHEYSVAGIMKNVAQLKLHSATKAFADNLPLDLYALEMCDQIEATLTCTVLGDEDPEARVFMDFQFNPKPITNLTYQLDPFVFSQEPVRFSVEYIELAPPIELRQTVEQAKDDDKRQAALRDIQDWLLKELHSNPPPPVQRKEVTLCPWI
ncbi:MAG: hypothetical protein KJ077_25770 [Anaerolineae bacterium]|nr:hypothetical protein [Anaerolineae bacterium]